MRYVKTFFKAPLNWHSSHVFFPAFRTVSQISSTKRTRTKVQAIVDQSRISEKSWTTKKNSRSKTNLKAGIVPCAFHLTQSQVEARKLKILRITQSYFFRERDPGADGIRALVLRTFPDLVNCDSGPGFQVYCSARRSFSNMRYELYHATEQLADRYLQKHLEDNAANIQVPSAKILLSTGEITSFNARVCFDRAIKSIEPSFLDKTPLNSLVTVDQMLKNIIANAVSFWLHWKSGTEIFKSRDAVFHTICQLDRLTNSEAWEAPLDPIISAFDPRRNKIKPLCDDDEFEVEIVLDDNQTCYLKL